MNSSVALMFTAKTIATSAIILAANTLRMETPFTNKSDLLGQWIETEAKEDIGKRLISRSKNGRLTGRSRYQGM